MYSVADKTRANILKAARKLFVKQGFAATSISQIAGQAKINQSLIYHHFKNKENLWREVKQNIIHQADGCWSVFIEKLQQGSEQFESGEDFLRQYLTERFKGYTQSTDLVRMLQWQALEPKQLVLQGTSALSWDLFEKITQVFQAQGQISKNYTASEILFFINQLISSNMASGFQAKKITEKEQQKYFKLAEEVVFQQFLVSG